MVTPACTVKGDASHKGCSTENDHSEEPWSTWPGASDSWGPTTQNMALLPRHHGHKYCKLSTQSMKNAGAIPFLLLNAKSLSTSPCSPGVQGLVGGGSCALRALSRSSSHCSAPSWYGEPWLLLLLLLLTLPLPLPGKDGLGTTSIFSVMARLALPLPPLLLLLPALLMLHRVLFVPRPGPASTCRGASALPHSSTLVPSEDLSDKDAICACKGSARRTTARLYLPLLLLLLPLPLLPLLLLVLLSYNGRQGVESFRTRAMAVLLFLRALHGSMKLKSTLLCSSSGRALSFTAEISGTGTEQSLILLKWSACSVARRTRSSPIPPARTIMLLQNMHPNPPS
jgi:hypothetical protein